jgi:hypothetical protein
VIPSGEASGRHYITCKAQSRRLSDDIMRVYEGHTASMVHEGLLAEGFPIQLLHGLLLPTGEAMLTIRRCEGGWEFAWSEPQMLVATYRPMEEEGGSGDPEPAV